MGAVPLTADFLTAATVPFLSVLIIFMILFGIVSCSHSNNKKKDNKIWGKKPLHTTVTNCKYFSSHIESDRLVRSLSLSNKVNVMPGSDYTIFSPKILSCRGQGTCQTTSCFPTSHRVPSHTHTFTHTHIHSLTHTHTQARTHLLTHSDTHALTHLTEPVVEDQIFF